MAAMAVPRARASASGPNPRTSMTHTIDDAWTTLGRMGQMGEDAAQRLEAAMADLLRTVEGVGEAAVHKLPREARVSEPRTATSGGARQAAGVLVERDAGLGDGRQPCVVADLAHVDLD